MGADRLTVRRCCFKGCEAVALGGAYWNEGWYRSLKGFMRHACPEHAAAVRADDLVQGQHQKAWSETYHGLLRRAERWAEAAANSAHPQPAVIETQRSTGATLAEEQEWRQRAPTPTGKVDWRGEGARLDARAGRD